MSTLCGRMAEKYITRQDWAEECGKTVRTLRQWAADGKGPRPRMLGNTVVYLRSEVDEWLQSQGADR